MNKPEKTVKPKPTTKDKSNLNRLQKVKGQVTENIEKFEFHLASEKIYHYVWHEFADKIIEESKSRFRGEDEPDKSAAYETLEKILRECLKMLHPFMPFVTEEIYQEFFGGEDKVLMIENW